MTSWLCGIIEENYQGAKHIIRKKERLLKNAKSESKMKGSHLESIRAANKAATSERRTKAPSRTIRKEDYLEVIYELIRLKGYAASTDVSGYLNVTLPSVTKMMRKLDESRYLVYEKYRGIRLTEEGISVAKSIRERHDFLIEFFKMIGVNEETANRDAEGMEHHLQPETLKKLEEFVKLARNYLGPVLGK